MENRWILKSKKGFLGVLLTLFHSFFLCIPLRSAEAPVQNKAPEIIAWSGIRMITLGTRYMTEIPALASEWVLRNKDQLVKSNSEVLKQGEEIDKIAKSVAEGMRNVGKMLVLIGAAKEYTDYFEYKNNPNNPLNNSAKYSESDIEIRQAARLQYLQTSLGYLNEELKKQKISAEWLVNLFSSSATTSVTEKSLQLGLGKVGAVLEHLNVYGIGIQISSDIPMGALLATVFSRWLPTAVENIGGRVGIEDSVGILYYMKRKEKGETDPTASTDPLAQLQQKESYRFAARTYEQGGAQIDGVSYARGTKKLSVDINVSVKLTFLASTEVLREFDVMNLNKAQISELSTRNNISNTLSGVAKTVALKAQEKIQESFDKSKHFEFLSKDIQIAAARVWGHVDEDTGKVAEIPNMMLRLSMGNYKLSPVADRSSNDMFSLSGSLGSLTIDAIEK